MPMTVVTLSKVPPSLRGDLTKWMQEISQGVYVGNFNSRIREKLWSRIIENIGNGNATISYEFRNEIGYNFETYNTTRKAIIHDGIPLVMIPLSQEETSSKFGFSNASKFLKINRIAKSKNNHKNYNYVVVDIETDGLDFKNNNILEIGALKILNGKQESFDVLINSNNSVPNEIVKLTGINESLLTNNGLHLEDALNKFKDFIGDNVIVGYSISFDLKFLNHAFSKVGDYRIENKIIDLLQLVKREKMFLNSYKLENVLKSYEINKNVPHRGGDDVKLIYALSNKVNGFYNKLKKESH